MQEDKLRDSLKFFRFNLPWFVLSAGFFAVILFAAIFISSKMNVNTDQSESAAAAEKLELAVSENIEEEFKIAEQHSSPSAIQIPSPSSIVTPSIPANSPAPKAPEKAKPPTTTVSQTPEPTAVPISNPTPKPVEAKDIEDSTYVVKAGDSLWTIAERAYGTGFEYKRIMTTNNIVNQFKLAIGQTLVIPANPAKGQIASGVSIDHGDQSIVLDEVKQVGEQKGEYKVVRGDSLWTIAEQQLGNPYRWTEIYELNKKEIGPNPNLIYPETSLKLPEKLAVKIDDEPASASSSSTNTSSNWTSSLIQ